jgi:DNA-binding CsgD family transcriptional regulator
MNTTEFKTKRVRGKILPTGLTMNEMVVYRLLASGHKQKEIAAILGIRYPSVGKFVFSGMRRTGCGTPEQLIYKLTKQNAI